MVSVVAHREQEDVLLVRARVRGDVERFALHGGIEVVAQETPSADYRFRALMSRAQVARVLDEYTQAMLYPNFKNAVPEDDRHNWYSGVWGIGLRQQEGRPRWGSGDLFDDDGPMANYADRRVRSYDDEGDLPWI